MRTPNYGRRRFIAEALLAGTAAGVTGLSFLSGCASGPREEGISPVEDLMREHGLLNRILLIYDDCIRRSARGEQYPLTAISSGAAIIRSFIEEYHEKLEEDHIFPCFENAGQMKDLVFVLRQQHKAGRSLTGRILDLAGTGSLGEDQNQQMTRLLMAFITMYRPHEAREDTVLFPALSGVISESESADLGEKFEQKEHQLFGPGGFQSVVSKVAEIEKQLGIYELSQFTPVT